MSSCQSYMCNFAACARMKIDILFQVFSPLCSPFNLLFHIVPSPLCIKLCTKPIKNEDCTRDKKTGIGTGLSHALHSDLLLFSLQSNFKKVCGREYEKCPSTKIMVGKKKKTTVEKKERKKSLNLDLYFCQETKTHMTLYVFCHIW